MIFIFYVLLACSKRTKRTRLHLEMLKIKENSRQQKESMPDIFIPFELAF